MIERETESLTTLEIQAIDGHNDQIVHVKDMTDTEGWRIVSDEINALLDTVKDVRLSNVNNFLENKGFARGLQAVLDIVKDKLTAKRKENTPDNPPNIED